MRRDLLIAAKKAFLNRYPMGFEDPEMEAIRKKHKHAQMHAFVKSSFEPEAFNDTDAVIENINKTFSRSSMVSVFEKMRYRDFAGTLNTTEKVEMAEGLRMMLHEDHEPGFAIFMHVLEKDKMAKWPLMTAIPYYFAPDKEVFIKPTTVKRIINVFELEGLTYSPKPSYGFYTQYKAALTEMRAVAGQDVVWDFAAFSGFLMMSMDLMDDPDIIGFKGATRDRN